MRRLVLGVSLLALVPALIGVARAERPDPAAAAVPAPTLGVAAAEHRATLRLQAAEWLKAHPLRIPVVFDWPAQGTITGAYGSDGGRPHPGIDIGILRNLTVRSATAGRVIRTGCVKGYEGYGEVVVVRSGALHVLYAHLSKIAVRRGELLRRDQRVGTAGCTGWCTGTHLHFEVRKGTRTLNPLRMLTKAS